MFKLLNIKQRFLGRVRQQESHETASYQQGGHSKDRNSTGCLNKVAKNKVAKNGPEPGGHKCHSHGGGPQVGGEKFHSQAIQGVEAHCGNGAKDTADDEVHGGAVDKVDEEGGAAAEEHGEDQEELSSKLVHVEDGPEVAWPSRD